MSDLPPRTPGTAPEADAAPTDDDRVSRRRRLLIVVAAVVVVIVLGAGLVVLVGGDDGDGTATAVEPWNAIIATHPESGELTIYDADGDEIDVIDTGFDAVEAVQARQRFALAHEAGVDEPAIVPDNIGVLPGTSYITANDTRNRDAAIVGFEGGGTTVEGLTRSFNGDGVLVVANRGDETETLSFVAPGESFVVEDGPNVDEVAGTRLIDPTTAIVISSDRQLLRTTAGDPEPTELAQIDLGDDEVIISALSPCRSTDSWPSRARTRRSSSTSTATSSAGSRDGSIPSGATDALHEGRRR